MLPICGRTVLLYAPTIMRQPGRLKFSHPVPYPAREKMPNRAGFVPELGWGSACRAFPFLELFDVWILKIYIKSKRSCVMGRWAKSLALFLKNARKNKPAGF